MLDRQKRLLEVYEYARKYLGIHTQTDFANAIGCSRAVLSSALNGNEQYLTDNLFHRICNIYPGVFNIDYLLTGDGYVITGVEEAKLEERAEMEAALKEYRANHRNGTNNLPDSRKESGIDQSSLVNALLAAKDETIATLRDQIQQQQEIIQLLKHKLSDLEVQTGYHGFSGDIKASESGPKEIGI